MTDAFSTLIQKRLFIALKAFDPSLAPLEQAVKKMKISAEKRGINIKFSPPENWHITLQFLGTTESEKIHKIQDAMIKAVARVDPFTLDLKGVDAFDEPRSARVIWVGVSRNQQILNLHEALVQSLAQAQLISSDDEHSFVPHMTIARLRNPKSVESLIEPFKRKSFAEIKVRELVLYESVNQGFFPVYKPLFQCSLGLKETV